jgi:hypothetical protein
MGIFKQAAGRCEFNQKRCELKNFLDLKLDLIPFPLYTTKPKRIV